MIFFSLPSCKMSTKHGRTHQRPFNKMSPDGNLDTEIIDNNNPNIEYLVCNNFWTIELLLMIS
jgi:hypothetical protein